MAQLSLDQIIPGMKTADVVLAPNGQMLLPKGSILTEKVIEILKKRDIGSIEVQDAAVEDDFCAVYTEDMLQVAQKEAADVIRVPNQDDAYIQELKTSAVKIYLKRMSAAQN